MKYLTTHKLFIILFTFFLLLIISVFKTPLTSSVLVGGDLSYLYPEMVNNYTVYPYAWDWNSISGLGAYSAPLLGVHFSIIAIPLLGSLFHFSQAILYRSVYIIPYFLISLLSLYLFFKFFLQKSSPFVFFSGSIIFMLNTYILMVIGGGNFLIPIAYAFTPLVFFSFFSFSTFLQTNYSFVKQSFTSHISPIIYSLSFGLLLALQLGFDIRISFVTLFALFLFFLVELFTAVSIIKQHSKKYIRYLFYLYILPLFVLILINTYWLLPSVIVHVNPLTQLGSAYTSSQAVNFFSFARFENSIALLHPNWPDNIFGETYFMRGEFLLLPILVFIGLLFFKSKSQNNPRQIVEQRLILYFALVGLLGAFLAKGTNEPFGGMYMWMFIHIPGFNLFRDATKWYTLVAVSYSLLIPYNVLKISTWFAIRKKQAISPAKFLLNFHIVSFQNIFFAFIIIYLLFTIRQAVFGELTGTFVTHRVPAEYTDLKNFIASQPDYFRTMLVPVPQRYSYYTSNHPQISAKDFFRQYDTQLLVKTFLKGGTGRILQNAAVKYVIVPFDSEQEIFLKDRKYDDKLYALTVVTLKKSPWLREERQFGKIVVFRVSSHNDHFFIANATGNSTLVSNIAMINPTNYKVTLRNAVIGNTLVFSESFDPNWQLKTSKYIVTSKKYKERFNSFDLPESGNYTANIIYAPQKWIDLGLLISIISLSVVVFLILPKVKQMMLSMVK